MRSGSSEYGTCGLHGACAKPHSAAGCLHGRRRAATRTAWWADRRLRVSRIRAVGGGVGGSRSRREHGTLPAGARTSAPCPCRCQRLSLGERARAIGLTCFFVSDAQNCNCFIMRQKGSASPCRFGRSARLRRRGRANVPANPPAIRRARGAEGMCNVDLYSNWKPRSSSPSDTAGFPSFLRFS